MGERTNQHGGGLPPDVLGDDIPEAVLDELLVAFADRTTPRAQPTTSSSSKPTATPPSTPTATPAETPPDAAPPDRPITVITDSSLDGNATPVVDPPAAPPRSDAVVVIEADDQPDAVVLDGDPSTGGLALESDGKRAANRAGVDPRFRARRIAVRRAEGRKRLRWLVIAGVVVLAAVAVLAVLASPLFAIDRVDVDGAVYADPAAIQQVADSLHGEPILTADLDGAARRLERIPWVESARVTMHFPNRVTIEIAERAPVASFMGADGQFRVIDADAFVVAVLPNQPADYPPITGVLPNSAAGTGAGTQVRGASQLISALPPSLADRLTSVELATSGSLTLQLASVGEGAPLTVHFGAPDGYRDKLIAVLNRLTQEPQLSGTVDVSSGDLIVSA